MLFNERQFYYSREVDLGYFYKNLTPSLGIKLLTSAAPNQFTDLLEYATPIHQNAN